MPKAAFQKIMTFVRSNTNYHNCEINEFLFNNSNIPNYKFKGKSIVDKDFLVSGWGFGYLMRLSPEGNIVWSRRIPAGSISLQPYINNHYAFSLATSIGNKGENSVGCLMDETGFIYKFIFMKKCGLIKSDDTLLDSHIFNVLGENRFMVHTTINVNGYLQEVLEIINKDQVEFYFDTLDLFNSLNAESPITASDFAHLNAATFNERGNLILSFLNLGLYELDIHNNKLTKLSWSDKLQHDIKYYPEDNSYSFYNNKISGVSIVNNNKVIDYTINSKPIASLVYGGATRVQDNVYDICTGWGLGKSKSFLEVDLNTGEQYCSLDLNKSFNKIYNMWRV